MKNKNLEVELRAIKEICKEQNFSEEELLNRARLLYFINRLDFARELPILLDMIQYEVGKKKYTLEDMYSLLAFTEKETRHNERGAKEFVTGEIALNYRIVEEWEKEKQTQKIV